MKTEKKRTVFITAGFVMLFLTPLTALALMLISSERINGFRPAKQEVQIAENNGSPQEMQENDLEWSAAVNADGNYTANKNVSFREISNPNGEYLRVRFVPTWYDTSGCAVSGVEDVTDISQVSISGSKLTFQTAGSTTVLILNLADDWADNWSWNAAGWYFESKQPVKSGQAHELLESVEVPQAVMQAANAGNLVLRLDVLADSVQTLEDGDSYTNPRWTEPAP